QRFSRIYCARRCWSFQLRKFSRLHSGDVTEFTAYAVALEVERGWGEELAKNLLEMLRFDEAYRAGVWPRSAAERMPRTPQTYPPESGVLELGISSRKILE